MFPIIGIFYIYSWYSKTYNERQLVDNLSHTVSEKKSLDNL